jgi:hypothetical protein
MVAKHLFQDFAGQEWSLSDAAAGAPNTRSARLQE